jgi:hypothetical protein
MSIGFESAALWPFLGFVAAPVLVHLFARARPPRHAFSATDLLRRAVRFTMRVRRPRDWLLLALRTLLAAAAVLLFLRPVLYAARGGDRAGVRRHVVVVVDRTASMAALDGAQTRFAAACAEAVAVLEGLRSSDSANLVWIEARPRAEFPAMGANFEELRESLRRAGVSAQAGDAAGALEMAAGLLAGAEGRREICVVSDFQCGTWADARVRLPPDVHVSRIAVGRSPADNAAVARLEVDPPVPVVGDECRVLVEVRNHGDAPQRRTVSLQVGAQRLTQAVVLPPRGSASHVFRHVPGAAGDAIFTAGLDEDAYSADDERWTVAAVRPHLRAGLRSDDPAASAVLRQAIRALPWLRLEALSSEDLAVPAPPDVLLLAGWSGNQAEAARAWNSAGCPILCFPAAGLRGAAFNRLADGAWPDDARFEFERLSPSRGLRLALPAAGIFDVFESGARGDPARARFRSRLRVSAPAAGAEVPMTFDDGVPALACWRSAAHADVWLWNLPLNPADGNVAVQPEFLPLLAEVILAGQRGRRTDASDVTVSGQPLGWSLPSGVSAESVRLQNDAGADVPLRVLGDRVVSAEPPAPGIYHWVLSGQAARHAVVLFPEQESDLRPASPLPALGVSESVARSGRAAQRLRDGIRLWPWMLAAAAVLLLAEGIVAAGSRPVSVATPGTGEATAVAP